MTSRGRIGLRWLRTWKASRFAPVMVGATLLLGNLPGPLQAAPARQSNCVVGVSWNNFQEERWGKWDEPAIKDALTAGGATYISTDAKSSAETQASNVEDLITQGATVLIILAQDGTAIKPVVASAIAQGVPVIAYDRLIEDPQALYITFDNVEVGRMEARAVFGAQPRGNYVVVKGNQTDANSDFLRGGYNDIIGSAVASGDVKIVGETYTDNWDPSKAQTEMEQFLTQNENKVDAVLSENDGMAGGVVAALAEQGLAGRVPVSGQDGDAPALNRIAKGIQTVDVWKDSRMLGKSAGDSAVQMCGGVPRDQVPNVGRFHTPGNNDVSAILLQPQPINVSDLNIVLDAGWITRDSLCQGVPSGTVAVCQ